MNYYRLMLIALMLIPSVVAANMRDLPGIPMSVASTLERPVEPESIDLTPNFRTPVGASASTTPQPRPGGTELAATYQRPAQSNERIDPTLFDSTKVGLNVIPGENMILPISVASPNRLITPFHSPRVTTSSAAQITVEHSVIYVTPANEDLVTMFVTEEKGDQRDAISLTMVPRRIPPREVRLLLTNAEGKELENGGSFGGGFSTPFDFQQAGEWERRNDYVATIRDTMRELAQGRTPQGYGLRHHNQQDPQPSCNENVSVQPGQALDGHNMIVVVSVVTNMTNEPLQFKPSSCYHDGVLAVSAWPRTYLAPGGQAELFILYQRPDPAAESSTRPSLLGLNGGMRSTTPRLKPGGL